MPRGPRMRGRGPPTRHPPSGARSWQPRNPRPAYSSFWGAAQPRTRNPRPRAAESSAGIRFSATRSPRMTNLRGLLSLRLTVAVSEAAVASARHSRRTSASCQLGSTPGAPSANRVACRTRAPPDRAGTCAAGCPSIRPWPVAAAASRSLAVAPRDRQGTSQVRRHPNWLLRPDGFCLRDATAPQMVDMALPEAGVPTTSDAAAERPRLTADDNDQIGCGSVTVERGA